jgi:hypothetical protein
MDDPEEPQDDSSSGTSESIDSNFSNILGDTRGVDAVEADNP